MLEEWRFTDKFACEVQNSIISKLQDIYLRIFTKILDHQKKWKGRSVSSRLCRGRDLAGGKDKEWVNTPIRGYEKQSRSLGDSASIDGIS